MPNSSEGRFLNPEAEMHAFVNDDSLIASLEKQIRTIWSARLLIAACAIVAALAGYFAVLVLPKMHDTSVVVRPQSPSQFAEFATLLNGASGEWHRTENVATSGYELFLRNIRNKVSREAALSSQRALFPNTDFADRRAVLDLVNKVSVATGPDKSAKITFRYELASRGADFLNGYVGAIASATAAEMVGDGVASLEAVRVEKQRDLERLRGQRDITLKQGIARYDDALNTATASGIERPIVANLGSTAAIVSGNAQVPLYYYGSVILKSEVKNLEARIGDDLAIPDFPVLQSSSKDIESRLAALAQVKITPVIISEDAFQSDVSVTPSPGLVALGFLLAGGLVGYVWALMRARRQITRA
jgi:LPS O-antigen subunit length determinant protein (WzzB/FepE family)